MAVTPERPPAIRFRGMVYRGHMPIWAWTPLSGEGARRRGGRFNRKGVPAFYASLSIHCAAKEGMSLGRPLQPITLCAYEVDSEPVFDATDPSARQTVGVRLRDLASDWRGDRDEGVVSPSQRFADRLIVEGFAGMLVRSFRPGTRHHDRNLVLWEWGDSLPSRVRLVDDEGRLASGRDSD